MTEAPPTPPQRGELGPIGRIRAGLASRRMLGPAVAVAVGSCVVKLVATVKDMALAASFGTARDLDCFFLAHTIAWFVIGMTAHSFHYAFAPAYNRVKQTDGALAAREFCGRVVTLTTALLVLAAFLTGVAAPFVAPLLGERLGSDGQATTVRLLVALTPLVALNGLSMLLTAVLNAEGKFALPAWAGATMPMATLALLFPWGSARPIEVLVTGAIAGAFAELAILMAALRASGLPIVPAWPTADPAIRALFAQYGYSFGAILLSSNATLVDQMMAAWLPPGSVSALNYGGKVVTAIVVIGSAAVATAALPYFSELYAKGDLAGVRQTLRLYRVRIYALGIPLALALAAGSECLAGLLFQRGAFTAADRVLVGQVQAMYALQLPFVLSYILSTRAVMAIGRTQALLGVGVANLVLNIGGNLLLSRWMGVAGIALSSTLVLVAADLALMLYLERTELSSHA